MAGTETDSIEPFLDQPPTAQQRLSAIAVVAVVLVAFAGVAPFSGTPLVQLNAFFPSLDAIVFVTDLITAILLFAQFTISRSRSLLMLANGYLFTAFIVVPHALTFSGAFSPTGLLGANIQTGSWIFIFWHLGFAVALLAYAVFRETDKRAKPIPQVPALPTIGLNVASSLGLVCGLTWLATAGASLLPPIILDNARISPFVIYPIWFTISISAAALITLLVRRRSMLDWWLIVVATVHIAELAFSGLLPSVRFSVGFYAGRVLSLITASIVLAILLAEATRLYVRLARSNAALQRERNNKLMSLEAILAAISHEVRQPLGAIVLNGETLRLLLNKRTTDLEIAESNVDAIIDDAHRANQVFDNIRKLFGKAEITKEPIDINALTLEVLRSFQTNLESQSVEISVELAPKLPVIKGHKGQLQEVIINLVQNAIEAMGAADRHRLLKVRTVSNAGGTITLTVEDTGRGFGSTEPNTIFDPFFTTKSHGMGLGLAISRTIVERHAGQLLALSANPHGAIFQITLPSN
jgi:signal transduction histidine kinase